MITKIKIENFRSITKLEFNINEMYYALAGQNESGKSSILEAIYLFEKRKIIDDDFNFKIYGEANPYIEITIWFNREKIFEKTRIQEIREKLGPETELLVRILEQDSFDRGIKNTKEFSIALRFTKEDNAKGKIYADKNMNNILKASLNSMFPEIVTEDNAKRTEKLDKQYDQLLEEIWAITPKFILFNDFEDLLPDKIRLSEIESKESTAQGVQAVLNLEKILGKKFVNMHKLAPGKRAVEVGEANDNITVNFLADWQQTIDSNSRLRISFLFETDQKGITYVYFFMDTKDGEPLPLRQRSKGLIWFFSLWLRLKVEAENKSKLLLFDEPGTYLHVKAHKDLKLLFKNISALGHQIIYSTHNPSLIDTDTLSNIGLVFNDIVQGTLVENITSMKFNSPNKLDALQPVAFAMGYHPQTDFTVLSQKNVILEGLSDFYYFTAMAKLLKIECPFRFIPALGIKDEKVLPLISFCIGYGLDWLLIMDSGNTPSNTKDLILKNIFANNTSELLKHVYQTSVTEIEDLFALDDFKSFDSLTIDKTSKKPSEIIGKQKLVIAKQFMDLTNQQILNEGNVSAYAKNNFSKIFKWITERTK